jgi:hypothetical protein
MYARHLGTIEIERPVFISGVPRGGTTLLLELLAAVPKVATHTYRVMPFVLAPLLWSAFSRSFFKLSTSQERAHGDGLEISFDSPEAFEEVIWLSSWREKYEEEHIALWTCDDRSAEFEEHLKSHMRKIIAWRADAQTQGWIYASKNNANIARIPLLRLIFPRCRILIPFRHPLNHAQSLLRQHIRFVGIHAKVPFTATYMASIGHFEFGKRLKAIAFPSCSDVAFEDPCDPNYWLQYWVRAYSYLLEQSSSNSRFIDFERFCERPEQGLEELNTTLPDLPMKEALRDHVARVHPATRYHSEGGMFDHALVRQAQAIHERLRAAAQG